MPFHSENAIPTISELVVFVACPKVSILSTFYAHLFCTYFCTKIFLSKNVTREKLCKALLYKKFVSKMLMWLTLGDHIEPLMFASQLVETIKKEGKENSSYVLSMESNIRKYGNALENDDIDKV